MSAPVAPTVPLNDLSRDIEVSREELVAALTRVVDSGWFVLGPELVAFEAELAAFLGVPHVAGVASGTDALELALRATVPSDRRTVVTAANCGGYTTTATRRAGLHARFADVDPITHLLTADTVAPVLDDSVGAVVVTHLYGRPADTAPLRALCRTYGIVLVEDCAQALGASTLDGRVGSLGDVATFSFYPTKNLGALGDAGAVATSNPDIDTAVRRLRQYGWEKKYTIGSDGGRNSRLDEMQAAVLRVRLPRLDAWNARRREIVQRYVAASPEGVRVLPADEPGHAAHLAVVESENRDGLVAHLAARGIATDIHYPCADHQQPALAPEYVGVTLPTTERLAARVLSLPLFPDLTDAEVDRVCSALREL